MLGYRLRGKNISEVLAMPVATARSVLADGQARAILDRLVDDGNTR